MTTPSERALIVARERWAHSDECSCPSCIRWALALDAFAAEAVRAERERCRTYNEIVTILFECDHGDEDMCGCRDKALTLMTTLRR